MKILYVTTISATINGFFKPHINMLVSEGHQVDIACNDADMPLDALYGRLGCQFHRVDFSRSPLSPDNIRAWGQLRKVVKNGGYDIVHCHTPNASAITRLVCRKFRKKTGLKVFYTAHGFHFYKGAPKLNWMVFYPVEKICARFTDKLITINHEDYDLAKRKLHAKEVHYVPGVGIDLSRFQGIGVDRSAKRQEIGVPEDATLMISVGELSERKNHRLAIKALSLLGNTDIHYVIVGSGTLEQELQNLAKEYQLTDRVHLLGYRKDVAELYKASDICCFPSFQEGLPVAVMEAMVCGLPVVCSDIRGNVDLINEDGGALFDPQCAENCAEAIVRVLNGDTDCMGKANKQHVENYSLGTIISIMKSMYESAIIRQ